METEDKILYGVITVAIGVGIFFTSMFVSSYRECRNFYSVPYCVTHLNTWAPIVRQK